ncbi:MAG: RNA polymerase sigma factor [candidate division Zixibacteria bacterium]|nr:RNA polymerase sigma factor [candidate division Zixibacteria bacterium]
MKQLLQQARDGDKTAEKKIFQYLHVRFSLFATHRIRDREAAEDVVQDSCITVLEKYKAETFTVGFDEWAWGVLQINIKSYFRRTSVENKRITSEQSVNDFQNIRAKDVDPDLEASILNCLEKITTENSRFAQVLSLVYQGYKTLEICRIMTISNSNCHVLLHRGRTMLRKCLSLGGYKV